MFGNSKWGYYRYGGVLDDEEDLRLSAINREHCSFRRMMKDNECRLHITEKWQALLEIQEPERISINGVMGHSRGGTRCFSGVDGSRKTQAIRVASWSVF